MSEWFFHVANLMACHLPEMVIAFLGIVLAFANWNRYPRPALLAFLGFTLMLGSNVALGAVYFYYLMSDPKWTSGIVEPILWGGRSFLNAGGYLLVMAAIYASRKPRSPTLA